MTDVSGPQDDVKPTATAAAIPAAPSSFSRGVAIATLAKTIWGEDRGGGAAGMAAVANVVINRLAIARAAGGKYWWGNDVAAICLDKWQFSCWNDDPDPRSDHQKMLHVTNTDPQYAQALQLAADAVDGKLPDTTHGATHYVAEGAHADWIKDNKPVAVIGRQIFYALVPVPKTT